MMTGPHEDTWILNLSGVDYRKHAIRLKKLIEDMTGSFVTIVIDSENEATWFRSDNGRFDSWLPWERQPEMGVPLLSHFLKDGSRMPFGCAL